MPGRKYPWLIDDDEEEVDMVDPLNTSGLPVTVEELKAWSRRQRGKSPDDQIAELRMYLAVLMSRFSGHVQGCERKTAEHTWYLRFGLVILMGVLGVLLKNQFHLGG